MAIEEETKVEEEQTDSTHTEINGRRVRKPEPPLDYVDLHAANKQQQAAINAQRVVVQRLEKAMETAKAKEQKKINAEAAKAEKE